MRAGLTALRRETLTRADFDRFVGDFNTRWSEVTRRLGALEAGLKALDKTEQKGYTGNSVPGSATPEQLSEETDMKMLALLACVALLPAGQCDAKEELPQQLPPLVVVAPPARSADMWDKYPAFFERFHDVWTNCPAQVFEPGRELEAAKWFNDHTWHYQRMVKTCLKYQAHVPKRTAWPPTPKTAQARIERFFTWQCQEGKCDWVQTK